MNPAGSMSALAAQKPQREHIPIVEHELIARTSIRQSKKVQKCPVAGPDPRPLQVLGNMATILSFKAGDIELILSSRTRARYYLAIGCS